MDFSRLYETFITLPEQGPYSDCPETYVQMYLDLLRSDVIPLINDLNSKGLISWYSFLRHDKDSGVPTQKDDENPYIHLRLELSQGGTFEELKESLPTYCIMTQYCNDREITGIKKSYLKDEAWEEAWTVIGESSRWIVTMLNSFAKDKAANIQQVAQFLHYISNATMLHVR